MELLTRLILLTAIIPANLVFGESVTCNVNQFRCNSGDQCIPNTWQCDTQPDCKDESDEKNCFYKPCTDQEFRCNSSKCISKADLCDNFDDCGQNEDESPELCKKIVCNATTHFTCARGAVKCIPLSKICDSHDDCADLSDESLFNCNLRPNISKATCRPDEFKCVSGGCISKTFLCDGNKDCSDKSDEWNSTCKSSKTPKCGSDYFQCVSDKKCISTTNRCDSYKDCADNSDEVDCPSPGPGLSFSTTCPGDNDFYCGIPGKCVTQGWRCDGEPDCPNGADERGCTTTTCPPPKLACNVGNKCIHHKQMCDGKNDCEDGSDESGCPKKNKREECDVKTHFRCSSYKNGLSNGKMCIPLSKVCDGVNDCVQGEDEAPGGKKSNCKRNPCRFASCTQHCTNRYSHAVCSCQKGFELQSDNATCVDINECNIWGMCSQKCENTKGGYKCSCEMGYQHKKVKDGKGRCVANGHKSLILASQEYIRLLRLDKHEERPVVSDLINVAGLDLNFKANPRVLFWSQPTPPAVLMAQFNLTGRPQQIPVYSKDNSVPEGLAFDWVHNLLYMTDPGLKRIAVINVTSQNKQAAVITVGDIDEPRGIAVDPAEGWLYWSDWGPNAKISKIGMNGQYRSVLVSENIVLPNALALDLPQRRLYWCDAKLHSIFTINLDGGDRRLIHEDPEIYPYSMSVFEDRIYWSDWHQESVLSVDKFTGEDSRQEFVSLRISAIRVMHRLMQPEMTNLCKNHPCSHFCLPAPAMGRLRSKPSFTCGCPEDLMLLSDDRTCASKGTPKSLSQSSSTTTSSTTTTTTSISATTSTATSVPPSTIPSIPLRVSTAAPTVARVTKRLPQAAVSEPVLPSSPANLDPNQGHTRLEPTTKKSTVGLIPLTTPQPLLGEPRRVGHVAGIVIGIVLLLTVIAVALMLLLYRTYTRKNTRSMNFDNPVYRKPAIDGEHDAEMQFPINSTLGRTTPNGNSVRAPIWSGGVVNGAVEA